MTYKTLVISLIYLLLTACISNRNSKNIVSSKKQAEVYLELGVRYLGMEMIETALNRLEYGLELDPQNADIHNVLGALYERLKQDDRAKKYYQNAINLDPNSISINNNYGRFLCEKDNYQEGLVLLQTALNMPLNKRKWFAYTNIGRCQLTQNQQQRAEANFRQALQYNKKYSPALFEMQKISYQMGNYMSARAFLGRYLAVSKHNSKTLWFAINTELRLGNTEQAAKYEKMLFSLFPASKEVELLKNNRQMDNMFLELEKLEPLTKGMKTESVLPELDDSEQSESVKEELKIEDNVSVSITEAEKLKTSDITTNSDNDVKK